MQSETIISIRDTAQAPTLSVLVPFYRYDPSALLRALAQAPAGVEFILIDDGSNSAELLANAIAAAEETRAPARIVVLPTNCGRAHARNRLVEEARGEYVLFLDADMLPDTLHFLSVWLGVIRTQAPAVAFGGLSLVRAQHSRETALHHALFGASDCQRARVRARRPAQSTASSNLLVRRDFLLAYPFDDGFSGWGFEDTDWALGVSRATEILHVDNPATHVGLDSVETLMRKSREAAPNFARLARKHPEQVRRFAAHRVARGLRVLPGRTVQRKTLSWLARDPMQTTPMRIRCAALKLLRASYYAEHLP